MPFGSTLKRFAAKHSVRICSEILSVAVFPVILALPWFSNLSAKWRIIIAVAAFLSGAFTVCSEFLNSMQDMKTTEQYQAAVKESQTYKDLVEGYTGVFKSSAQGLYGIARLIETGNTDAGVNRWSFVQGCFDACLLTYQFLRRRSGSPNVRVYYVQREGEDFVRTVAYANRDSRAPSSYRRRRGIHEEGALRDCLLFREGSEDPVYRTTPEAVNSLLVFPDQASACNMPYEQCIFLPVFCGDSEMVGLLVVFTELGVRVAGNDDEMRELCHQLRPMVGCIALMQKAERAAIAVPPQS